MIVRLMESSSLKAHPASPIRTLLVENCPEDAKWIERILTESSEIHVNLTHVNDFDQALKKVEEHEYDLILLDLSLPSQGEVEVFTRMRFANPAVPILVLIDQKNEKLAVLMLQEGAQDYLIKREGDAHLWIRSIRFAMERQNLENQLRQSQKIESLGLLAGGIAHDFNNLLTVSLGYTSLILNKLPKKDPLQSKIETIHSVSVRAAQLTKQLLTFSRRQVIHSQVVDLNQHMRELTEMIQRLLGENRELVMHLALNELRIKVDPHTLDQAIINMVLNARDAMSHGGKLTIETSEVELDLEYTSQHPGVTQGIYVVLSISDTGHGMSPYIQKRLFEPFFTTKNNGKGTGLGLSTAYGIVKQYRGHIHVTSQFGKGSTFKIYLPKVTVPLSADTIGKSTKDSLHGSGTILVVEDQDGIRKLLHEMLTDQGYTVYQASNGEEALELFKNGKISLDLLFTDVVMPKMGGIELAGHLKKQILQLKVLFTSGYAQDTEFQQKVIECHQKFIPKPYDLFDLLKKIRQILAEKT